MATLQEAASVIINKCMALKPDEKCLIIYDKNKEDIAKILFEEAKKLSNSTELLEVPIGKRNGVEPAEDAAKKMLSFDVIIMPTSMSLSHTKARREATKLGCRIATLPGVTKDMLMRTIDIDYDEMKELTNKIADELETGKIVRIVTNKGTDITLNMNGADVYGRKAGLFTKPGFWGNLPEAEVSIGPKQEGTNGVYVVDATQAGVGKLKNPIKITVKDGFAIKIEGGVEAEKLKQMLDSVDDKNAYNIAELGIGTNKKAIITGITLEDEKVYGTCHIALGNNISYGGDVDVPIHVDGIINKPTIFVDGKEIMRDGKLVI